jgi:hypothetical protein
MVGRFNMKREEVYAAVDSERDYQDAGLTKEDSHIVEEFDIAHALNAIQYNLDKAREVWYKGHEPHQDTMNYLRKIAGICVNMGEKKGMPKRELEQA